MGHKVTPGTNFHLSIETESKEEADKIFQKLSNGGKNNNAAVRYFLGFILCNAY